MRGRLHLLLAVLACAALAVPALASAGTTKAAKARAGNGVTPTGTDLHGGKLGKIQRASVARATARASRSSFRRAMATAEATPAVGTVRPWLANDDVEGLYLKNYTLRSVTPHAEIWVANDLLFPAGDCRNGVRTQITDADVQYFAGEFENVIYPKESETFSVPPDRDGTQTNPAFLAFFDQALLDALLFPGDGNKIVILIDNVRDENYYDTNNAHGFTYIAGFFWSVFNELADRNVMTIDAFDWLHRTHANPPHEPSTDLCTSAPARPFLYEGTFAHEYQHLLEYYADADEASWPNEGLSDWAQTLTGYVDPSTPVDQLGWDSHIQCFLGWGEIGSPFNPIPRQGGPENSLTVWGDQVPDNEAEILCDYGAAYSFMEFLHARFGNSFMTALHHADGNGLVGLKETIDQFGGKTTARELLHQWAAAMALDGVVDDGAKVKVGKAGVSKGAAPGRAERLYEVQTMNAFINWDNNDAYDTPGAPPNGSDYVRLRDAKGRYLKADQLQSIEFHGAAVHPAKPVEWTIDTAAPGHVGDAAFYSGAGDNFDRAVIREVTIPAAPATLSMETMWDTEPNFDSGFVQISTDGGKSWKSLGNADTTDQLDAGADPVLVNNLPGFNGSSDGWRHEEFDVSQYAGQTVLLSFRYVTDVNTGGDGWWVDDVRLNGALVTDGSSLDGWHSATQLNPVPVEGFTVQIVSYTKDHKKASVATLPLANQHDGSWSVRGKRGQLERLVEKKADTVAAIVMYDEPTESILDYAPYTLRVNGVLQPGGS